ncbi:MAG: hypothetical protein ACLGIG_11245 [Actinomycetes bacterium]
MLMRRHRTCLPAAPRRRVADRRAATAVLAGLLTATLAACADADEEPDTAAGRSAVETPLAPETSTTATPPVVPPGSGSAADPEAALPEGFITLPPGPRTSTAPPPPPAPGSLAALDWSQRVHPAPCPEPEVRDAVVGDLDGDGVDEVAVPVVCPGPGSVPVFAGSAADPQRLGDALPAEEQARLYSVEVRDGYLVVTAVRPSDGSGEDTAVTSRWVVRGGQLTRTDRWEDPASVLDVDAG